MNRARCVFCLIVTTIMLAGCAHYPVNPQLAVYDQTKGYRFKNLSPADNTDSLFVILAFSGGGTRAAAFSYGVMKALKDTEITWEGSKKKLLDEVDVISSISGGSFTAAYYAVYGNRLFEDYEQRFLKKDVQAALARQLANPVNWFRLISPAYSRIDMAEEYYNENIFSNQTYKTLIDKNRRPFLIVNATDMTLGSRFEFTQDQFDAICADLAGFHLSRAVAASAAFPGLLNAVTLNNYADSCGYLPPQWVSNALNDYQINPRRYRQATNALSYLDPVKRPYLHLLDGGIADNIGLRGPIAAITSNDPEWSLLNMINNNRIKKIVVITVNAQTDPDKSWDTKEGSPDVMQVMKTAINAPMDNYSFETIEQLRISFELMRRDRQQLDARAGGVESPFSRVKLYDIYIGFDGLEEPYRHFFRNLPTTFALPSETVDKLEAAGETLLRGSDKFKALLQDIEKGR